MFSKNVTLYKCYKSTNYTRDLGWTELDVMGSEKIDGWADGIKNYVYIYVNLADNLSDFA